MGKIERKLDARGGKNPVGHMVTNAIDGINDAGQAASEMAHPSVRFGDTIRPNRASGSITDT